VTLYDDESITDVMYADAMRSVQAGDWVELVEMDVPNEVTATYRVDRGWLKVFISTSRMMQFNIGPTLQASEAEAEALRSIAVESAEAFLSR